MKYIGEKTYANLWHNTVITVKHEHYYNQIQCAQFGYRNLTLHV